MSLLFPNSRLRCGQSFGWAGGLLAVLLGWPALVSGHGFEFLMARLDLHPDGLRVEVIADSQDNPLIEDEAVARAVIQDLFEVAWTAELDEKEASANQVQGWGELSEVVFERRSQLDGEAPIPLDPTFEERQHELLCGVWQWKPPPGSWVQLRVPRGQALDTLLWQPPTVGGSENQARWQILITGDHSAWLGPFAVPSMGSRRSLSWIIWVVAVLGLGLAVLWRQKKAG